MSIFNRQVTPYSTYNSKKDLAWLQVKTATVR